MGECLFCYWLTRVVADRGSCFVDCVIIHLVILLAYVSYFASSGFSLFFSTSQEIGWEEHPQNDVSGTLSIS